MEFGLDAPVLLSTHSTGDLMEAAPGQSSGAYGMRTLRSLRSSKPSGRLQEKISVTYNYFLEEVDPVIGDCITYLLCTQPKDVPTAMLQYLKKKSAEAATAVANKENNSGNNNAEAPSSGSGGISSKSSADPAVDEFQEKSSRPKKEQKLYLAMSIGPVVAKLVNRVAITRPKRVVDFLCHELCQMIYGSVADVPSEASNYDEVDDRFAIYGTFVPGKKTHEPSLPPTADLEVPALSATAAVPETKDEPVAEETPVPTAPAAASFESVATVNATVLLVQEEVKPVKNLQLAVLGMDSAGKSSILNALQGKSDVKTRPTIGFRPIAMMLDEETRVRFYDLGGGVKIRDIWNQYYHDVHAVVYVFDSADAARMNESIQLFNSTMKNVFLVGKPLLVFANKSDLPTAVSAEQLSSLLNLSVDFPAAKVVSCSAILQERGAVDAAIDAALESVLVTLQTNYDALNARVESDTKQKARDEAVKRLERERKVLKNKIACAYPDLVDPKFKPEVPAGPEDSLTMEEGHTFLAAEIGEDVAGLPSSAVEIAQMVGFQRLALQIIGALKAPISKKKEPLQWEEIRALVVELRCELGIKDV